MKVGNRVSGWLPDPGGQVQDPEFGERTLERTLKEDHFSRIIRRNRIVVRQHFIRDKRSAGR